MAPTVFKLEEVWSTYGHLFVVICFSSSPLNKSLIIPEFYSGYNGVIYIYIAHMVIELR